MSLIGLVRHMAEVERNWFHRLRRRRVGDRRPGPIFYDREVNIDGDFDDVDPATVDADIATWQARDRCGPTRCFAGSISMTSGITTDRRREFDLRWVLTHMIEEYARHNGHADLLREAIDGTTGD